jgi:hypothetical protein
MDLLSHKLPVLFHTGGAQPKRYVDQLKGARLSKVGKVKPWLALSSTGVDRAASAQPEREQLTRCWIQANCATDLSAATGIRLTDPQFSSSSGIIWGALRLALQRQRSVYRFTDSKERGIADCMIPSPVWNRATVDLRR